MESDAFLDAVTFVLSDAGAFYTFHRFPNQSFPRFCLMYVLEEEHRTWKGLTCTPKVRHEHNVPAFAFFFLKKERRWIN